MKSNLKNNHSILIIVTGQPSLRYWVGKNKIVQKRINKIVGGANMYFTDSDIEELTKKYRENLKKSSNELGSNAPELSKIQEWMAKNMIQIANERMPKNGN